MLLEMSWCLKFVNNVFPNLKQAIKIVIHSIKKYVFINLILKNVVLTNLIIDFAGH